MAKVTTSGSSLGLYSASGARRNGIGGLATGLETDELIKGMTSGTRGKIARKLQNKQSIAWKAAGYQGVSSKLVDFQKKYLSYSSPATNLYSESTFDRVKVNAMGENGKYIDVTGSSAGAGSLSITEILSMAKKAGVTSGNDISSKVLETGEINLGEKTLNSLAGETIYIEFDGKQHAVTFDKNFTGTDAASVVAEFNSALGKIRLDGGSTLGQKLEVSAGVAGEGGNPVELIIASAVPDKAAKIISGSKSALDTLGLKAGAVSSNDSAIGSIDATKIESKLNFKTEMAGKTMTFSFNGSKQNIVFTEEELNGVSTMDEFKNVMQTKLDRAFGKDRVKVNTSGGSATTGKLEFTTMDTTSKFKFEQADGNIAGVKGVFSTKAGESNRINQNLKPSDANFKGTLASNNGIYKMSVNGKEFQFDEGASVADIVYKINSDPDAGVTIKYLDTVDRFTVTSTKSGASGNIDIQDIEGNLAEVILGGKMSPGGDTLAGGTVVNGEDAKMKIKYGDGTEEIITRDTNTFELDGLNITVKGTFNTGEAINFNTVAETDDLMKTIKDMINDFNEMSELINKELTTRPNRDYQPLTDEQKEGMSEKEIEKWDEKANSGLLFADNDLSALATEIRFAFSFGVDGKGDVAEFGITSSSAYKDYGKLVLDEDKLKAALESRPDDVKKLFTTAQSDPKDPYSGGIMTRMVGIYNKYAKTEGEPKGLFITKAGQKDTISAMNSTMQKQLDDLDSDIKRLKATLKAEEDRYYRQFTKLEQVTAQMNSQSSWLTQQ